MLVQGEGCAMNIRALRKLPKEKLQKIILVCVLTLITFVGVIEFYVLKNWADLTATKDQIAKLQDQIDQAERKERNAKQDVAYRAEVNSFVETQRAAMVSGDPFAWVVREISLLAEQHPVRITNLRPAGKDWGGKSKSQTYTTHIDLSGTYDQIGLFVSDLENKFPTAEVQTLSVSGNADDKGQHGAQLEIVLRAQPVEPTKKVEAKKKA
jgi:hypothetical protein